LVWDSVLPAADLDLVAVVGLVIVFDALDAAFGLVTFALVMMISFLFEIFLFLTVKGIRGGAVPIFPKKPILHFPLQTQLLAV